jgi:hypothetical protein
MDSADPGYPRSRAAELVMRRWLACAICVAALSNAASAQKLSCTPPQKPMLDVEFLLGRGTASDARWRQFLAHEVTPRFPDGLTVYEATGQWRDPQRKVVVREKSRVLRIIIAADEPANDKIAAVAEAYKKAVRAKVRRRRDAARLRVILTLDYSAYHTSKIDSTPLATSATSHTPSTTPEMMSITPVSSAGFFVWAACSAAACPAPRGGAGASATGPVASTGLSLFIVFPYLQG